MIRVFESVPCPVCGCGCDDLRVTTADGRVVSAENACPLATLWFERQNATHPPAAAIEGNPVEPAAAYDRAAAALRAAKSPLIYGLNRTSRSAIRAATALADRIGATVDVAAPGHAAATVAMQQVGQSTCTLGEVKQRADLVIFWGCDPMVTHPRLIERYCPPRPGRTIVVVDEEETATPTDQFVRVTPGRHWEVLWQLRLAVTGQAPNPPAPFPRREGGEARSPSPLRGGVGEGLTDFATRMAAARFGVIFFGERVTSGPNAHRTVEALFQLVTDLNRHTRFYALRLGSDLSGATAVLTWQFGYPFGVDLAAGYPRYNPGEFTGPDVLARNEVDACVLVGSAAARELPPPAVEHLKSIPVVVLDPPDANPFPATVRFTTAAFGVHGTGTAHRLDGVTLPLRALLPTEYPDPGDVLNEILRRIPPK